MATLNYLELPVTDMGAAKRFYADAFGWSFTDYGPDYAAAGAGASELGLNGDPEQRTAQLLPVIAVSDLAEAERRVLAAGGAITLPAFDFPGGRRFHFRDVAGHELAAMQPDAPAER